METKDKNSPVFYYDREKRLNRSSDNAKYITSLYNRKKPGFFKSLTATSQLRYLFFSIIFMSIAFLLVSYIYNTQNVGSIAGVQLNAKALWFENNIYVTVSKGAPWYMFWAPASHTLKNIDIYTGYEAQHTSGILQASEASLKLRFESIAKPTKIVVRASADSKKIDLIVNVE